MLFKRLIRAGAMPIQLMLKASIRLYQLFISPFLANRCRFYPSCSQYAIKALDQHGVIKGTMLTLRRLLKCHPLHPGGVDMVPHQRIKE